MHLHFLIATATSRAVVFAALLAAVYGAACAAPARHPAYEPTDVFANLASAAQPNLFLKAKVTASGQRDKQTADLAVDGESDIPGKFWACANLPVWLTVDMGESKTLSCVRIWPYWADGRDYQYKIEGSNDGQTWVMLADQTANSICGTPEGCAFRFDPVQVRYVRTTFTGNSKGAADGGRIVEIAGYAAEPDTRLCGGIGSTDKRYAPDTAAASFADPKTGIRLTGWRGERVNAHVAVWSPAAQSQLRLEPATLSGSGAAIPVQTYFVRSVLADGQPQADILDTAPLLHQPAGAVRPIWISVDVPPTAAPGIYTGEVVVRCENGAVKFPVSLEVLAATLPAPKDWAFHLDLWQHPQAVARWHDVTPWSPEHFAQMKPLMQRLAHAGQKTITCAIIDEPWNAQTYDAFPSMIEWRKNADGTWSYDYTIFDRWVTFMTDEVGMPNARIHCYTMVPWSLRFRYYDVATAAFVDLPLRPGTAAYDAYWGRFLEDFVRHLKEKGWLERARIGMDERPDALMRGALDTLNRHAPALKVASAINKPSDLTRAVDDVSPDIRYLSQFSAEELAARRAQGKKTTFYVCCNPPVPNTFTDSPPAEAEWLGIFAAAQNCDGFLRWAYNSWVADPLTSTDYTSWHTGDCFLVYPGNRSSVRFERLRDGIEEAEKIRMLCEAVAAHPSPAAKAAMENVDSAVAQFTWKRGQQPDVHAADVARAKEAVEGAAKVVFPVDSPAVR